METKICSKCNIEKPISEFYLRKDTGKYRNVCKGCRHKPYPETENDRLLKENKRRCKVCKEIKDLSELNGIGHRIVHGGEKFADSVLITDEVIEKLETFLKDEIDNFNTISICVFSDNKNSFKSLVKSQPSIHV